MVIYQVFWDIISRCSAKPAIYLVEITGLLASSRKEAPILPTNRRNTSGCLVYDSVSLHCKECCRSLPKLLPRQASIKDTYSHKLRRLNTLSAPLHRHLKRAPLKGLREVQVMFHIPHSSVFLIYRLQCSQVTRRGYANKSARQPSKTERLWHQPRIDVDKSVQCSLSLTHTLVCLQTLNTSTSRYGSADALINPPF